MVEISKRDWKLFREKLPKSDMLIDLVRLVQDKVIGLEDLSDFSEDVQ